MTHSPSMRKILLVILIGLIMVATFSITKAYKKNINEVSTPKEEQKREILEIDFNGDGSKEKIFIEKTEAEYKVFSETGEEMEFADAAPILSSEYRVVKLNEKSKKEYIQWDNYIGLHQIQTFFYTLFNYKLQALPAFDFEKEVYTYAFYNSRNELGVGDFTSDGLKEIVETVDEYPPNASQLVDQELEDTTRKLMITEGISEKDTDSLVKIYTRENYGAGRGDVVIWTIHSFVESEAPFFRKLKTDEYNEIADRYVPAMNKVFKETDVQSKLMKVSDLSQDSIDFNLFVKDFWTQGENYEFPIEEE